MVRFLRAHKTLLISVGFLVVFSFAVTNATPPSSPYVSGATLDPQCAPGDTNCTVSATPWVVNGNDLYYNTGNVGIGTTTPTSALDVRGQVTAANISVTGTGGTVGTPSGAQATIVYGSGSYTASQNIINYRVYAYKIINSTRVYSAGFATLGSDITDDNSSNPYTVHLTWTAVAGADGYRVLIGHGTSDANYQSGSHDVTTNSLNDDGCGTVCFNGQLLVTPTSNFSNVNTINGLLSLTGNLTVSGTAAVGTSVTATGVDSSAFGISTTADSYATAAFGRFNIGGGDATSWVGTDPLFEVGNGTDSAHLSDALIILKNGNVGIGLVPPQAPQFTLSVNGSFSASGTSILSGNSVTLGNNTGSPQVNVVARGDGDGLRLYSLQNPNGGGVNPPSIGFYRSTTTPSSLPRFRILGSQPDGGDGDGFALSSPNSSITWITGGSDGVVFPNTSYVLDFQRQSYFSQGTIVVGNDTNGLTVPTDGFIRSGQKSFTTVSDVAGSNLTLAAGGGTGASLVGGNIYLQTPDTNGTTGGIQPYTTKATLARSGFFGIGTTTPQAYLDVTGTVNNTEQLRLAYDTNYYTNFRTTSNGSMNITPTGGAFNVNMNVPFSIARNLYKNTSNTSDAGVALEVQSGGDQAADSEVWFGVSGEIDHGWSMGLDHSDGYKFKISGPHGDVGNLGVVGKDKFTLDENGDVGIGTTTPLFLLHIGNNAVVGTVARFENSSGTCDINPTSSSLSCSSDMNLKKNITLLADNSAWSFNSNITVDNQSILTKVLALTPVAYNWKTENDTEAKHDGFIAQDVRQLFPDLVSQDRMSGLLSLNYTGLIPYTIEAIKEMNVNITDIADLTKTNTWRDALLTWLGSATNGIKNIFSTQVTTQNLCVGTDADKTCITKAQLDQLLQQQQVSAPVITTSSVSTDSSSTNTPTGNADTQSPEVPPPAVDTTATQSPEV